MLDVIFQYIILLIIVHYFKCATSGLFMVLCYQFNIVRVTFKIILKILLQKQKLI